MDTEEMTQLRRIIVRLGRELNASSAGEGLTPSQSSALGLIVGQGPLSLAELGELEGLSATMLSRVVGSLQVKNLISRTTGPSDLRTASVSATETGSLAYRRIQQRQAALLSRCLQFLDDSEKKVLLAALPALQELAWLLQRPLSDLPGPVAD
jgi:DNA-binding MarR family transcriptional regulator